MEKYCKSSSQFLAKNITTFDFVSSVRLDKFSNNDFVNPIALRKAKIVGLSECVRVKQTTLGKTGPCFCLTAVQIYIILLMHSIDILSVHV